MAGNTSFADLLIRLRAGENEAAAEVFQRFTHRLIGLARSRLDRLIRQKIDPEEVVQSVYKSFFLGMANGQFQLPDWDTLWSLLTVITVRKCGHQIAYFQAACRDVRQEHLSQPIQEDSSASWEAIAREPTPEEALVLTETVEELMRELKTARHRKIVSLSLQGLGPARVAEQVQCTERTVQRVLEQVKSWLERP